MLEIVENVGFIEMPGKVSGDDVFHELHKIQVKEIGL